MSHRMVQRDVTTYRISSFSGHFSNNGIIENWKMDDKVAQVRQVYLRKVTFRMVQWDTITYIFALFRVHFVSSKWVW
jgi:hypothetical protein